MSVTPARPPASSPEPRDHLDAPLYGATIRQAVVRFWRKSAVFSGRASRSEYWWWVLVSVVVSLAMQVMTAAFFVEGFTSYLRTPTELSPLEWLWAGVTLVPVTALTVRRLHDSNRSGWWALLTVPDVLSLLLPAALQPPINPFQTTGPALVLSLITVVCGLTLLVLTILDPDRRGARYDRTRSE